MEIVGSNQTSIRDKMSFLGIFKVHDPSSVVSIKIIKLKEKQIKMRLNFSFRLYLENISHIYFNYDKIKDLF